MVTIVLSKQQLGALIIAVEHRIERLAHRVNIVEYTGLKELYQATLDKLEELLGELYRASRSLRTRL